MYFKQSMSLGFLLITILFIGKSYALNSASYDKQEKNINTNEQKVEAIQKLQEDVEILKQQFILLNQNQQAIAKKSGLLDKPKQHTLIVGNSAAIGENNAKVVLIEFTDLHCPYCRKFHISTFPKIQNEFINPGKLLFVGKHLPIMALHNNALTASQALECSREQESKRNEFYLVAKQWMFTNKTNLTKTTINSFINEIGLNKVIFEKCMHSSVVKNAILKDVDLAKSIGLQSTPSFLIGLHESGKITNWKTFVGAKSFSSFNEAINKYLILANEKDGKLR